MKTNFFSIIITATVVLFLPGCDPEKEEFQSSNVTDYFPLQVGKYITYRLDSTVFTVQGRAEEVHSYQEKHEVNAQVTDNLGRPSYRIFRYIRDLAGTQAWRANGTYFITPLENSIEIIENNLRIVRLISPIREGTTWKGNRYLATNPYGSQYTFSNDDAMADWEFTIDSVNTSFVVNGTTIDSVITITQVNESINVPITDARSYAFKSLSVDKFAKNIGLIYQELVLWEYQPNPGGTAYKVGFGIKRTMIDRN
ncbi:MAG: hypothetical protein ABR502_09025 [Chitinophagaceae bacterium]